MVHLGSKSVYGIGGWSWNYSEEAKYKQKYKLRLWRDINNTETESGLEKQYLTLFILVLKGHVFCLYEGFCVLINTSSAFEHHKNDSKENEDPEFEFFPNNQWLPPICVQ